MNKIVIFLYNFRDILQNIYVFVSFCGYFFCFYLKIVAVCVKNVMFVDMQHHQME